MGKHGSPGPKEECSNSKYSSKSVNQQASAYLTK